MILLLTVCKKSMCMHILNKLDPVSKTSSISAGVGEYVIILCWPQHFLDRYQILNVYDSISVCIHRDL